MIQKISALAFVTVTMLGAVYAEEVWEDGVLVLTDKNFKEVIANYDYLMVNFYAPSR